MERPPLLRGAQQRLVADLPLLDRGDRGVLGCGIEAQQRQRGGYFGTRKMKIPTRFPSTNQVTLWTPGMFEVTLLT